MKIPSGGKFISSVRDFYEMVVLYSHPDNENPGLLDFMSTDWGYGKTMIYVYTILTYYVATPLRASQAPWPRCLPPALKTWALVHVRRHSLLLPLVRQ